MRKTRILEVQFGNRAEEVVECYEVEPWTLGDVVDNREAVRDRRAPWTTRRHALSSRIVICQTFAVWSVQKHRFLHCWLPSNFSQAPGQVHNRLIDRFDQSSCHSGCTALKLIDRPTDMSSEVRSSR